MGPTKKLFEVTCESADENIPVIRSNVIAVDFNEAMKKGLERGTQIGGAGTQLIKVEYQCAIDVE